MFCILLPTYNGATFLRPTLDSLLSQSFSNFKIIICDDKSTDNTVAIAKSYKDKRIIIKTHSTNLGYSQNLERARSYATGEYIFLMGQDDILAPNSLQEYFDTFKKHPQIGAITRPYYWFFDQVSKPVRYKISFPTPKTKIINIKSNPADVVRVFDSLDQLSGLCYRADLMTAFHPDIFPCHIYPFSRILLTHSIAYLPHYTIAVRITSSQTRFLSSIYNKSPLQSWVDMVISLGLPHYLITTFIAVNYVGLVQIKNYSTFTNLLREIYLLVKYRPKNLLTPAFWFFTLGTLIIPTHVLIPLVDWYKNQIYSRRIPIDKITYGSAL